MTGPAVPPVPTVPPMPTTPSALRNPVGTPEVGDAAALGRTA